MFPIFTNANRLNSRFANLKLFCEFPPTTTISIQFAYLQNLFNGQFTSWMVFASRPIFRVCAMFYTTTFFISVFHIFLVRSQKQMKRISAFRVIASVANAQLGRILQIINFIRNAVYVVSFPDIFRADAEFRITPRNWAMPFPTTIGLNFNFVPKSINFLRGKFGQFKIFYRHNLLLNSRLWLGSASVYALV